MYLYPLVLLIPLGIAAAGLMGVWPVAIPLAIVGMLLAILLFMRGGREGVSAARRREPTGETRPPGGAGRGGAVTANERVGQG
jgi:hypothetical protein